MSWLISVLNIITETEERTLCGLHLKGKERKVYDLLWKNRNSKALDVPAFCEKLEITQTHYYKINSVLIGKIYICLYKNEKLKLFYWLKKNGLYTLLKNEISNVIKLPANYIFDDTDSSNFYLQVFHLCLDLPFETYNEKLTDAIGELYLSTKNINIEAEKNYVKFHKLFANCNRNSATRNPQKLINYTITFFDDNENELLENEHWLALYYLYRMGCNYYFFYESNAETSLNFINKAVKIKDKISYFFNIDLNIFLELNYADILLSNNLIAEAFEKYNKQLGNGVDENMFGYYYHFEQYVISSICTNNFDVAQNILSSIFDPLQKTNDAVNKMRGLLGNAKLALSSLNFRATLGHLNAARNLNNKSFYLPFDLQIRVIENICFVMKNDLDFAKQLASRNLKFLQGLPSKKNNEDYFTLFKTIFSICTLVNKKQKLSASIHNVIQNLNNKFASVYCNLIKRLQIQQN